MQRRVQTVDPQLPFARFRTIDDLRAEAVAGQRAEAILLGSLAALAVLLAAIGLYGLVAGSVTERTRELGIRLTLGATPYQITMAAALPGIALGIVGVSIGLLVGRLGGTAMRSLVWGVAIGDPLTFVLTAGAVLVVVVIATLVPALRIVRLNPIRALRNS
jgi:putative ABC transport system permease protein